jgi:phosphate transport system permease protein
MNNTAGMSTQIKLSERIITFLVRAAGYLSILYVGLIILFLLREGLPAIGTVDSSSLFGRYWYPIEGYYSLIPLIAGSLTVTIGAALIAVPLGIGTAVLSPKLRRIGPKRFLKPLSRSWPHSIGGVGVYRYFGVVFVSAAGVGPAYRVDRPGRALLLGYAAVPTIVSVAEDALNTVPRSYREAALSIGATRWQTIWGITLRRRNPACSPR